MDGPTDPFIEIGGRVSKEVETDSYLIHDWGFKLMAKRINFSPLFSFIEVYEKNSKRPMQWCCNAAWLLCPTHCIPYDDATTLNDSLALVIVSHVMLLQGGITQLPDSLYVWCWCCNVAWLSCPTQYSSYRMRWCCRTLLHLRLSHSFLASTYALVKASSHRLANERMYAYEMSIILPGLKSRFRDAKVISTLSFPQ